jgi:hypothetical protein
MNQTDKLLAQDPIFPNQVKSDLGIWQKDGMLICESVAELPHCCIKCGSKDAPVRKTRRILEDEAAGHFVKSVILASTFHVFTHRVPYAATLKMSLCRRHLWRWRGEMALGVFIILLGVCAWLYSGYVFSARGQRGPYPVQYIGLGAVIMVVANFWIKMRNRILWPDKITTNLARMRGAGKQLTSTLPVWRGEIY